MSTTSATGPTGTTSASLFVRNATGLVRELGVWDVFLINIVMVAPVGNFIIFLLLGPAIFPGVDMTLATITAMGVGTSLVVLYSLLAKAMPRTGGDYVFVSRILHPSLGFIASWMMMLTAAFWPAYGAWSAGAWILPGICGILGKWLGNQTLVNLAADLPTTGWLVGVGLVFIVYYFAIGLLGLRWAVRMQAFAFVFMIISVLIALPGLLSATSSSFTANFNSFASHYGTSASQLIHIATKDGYTGPGHFSWGSTIAFWPFIMLLTGYAIVTIAMSGEVRNPGRTQMIGTVASNLFGALTLAALFVLVLSKIDPNLLGALGFFSFVNGTHNPFPYPLYGHVLMGIQTGSPWITLLVGLSVLSAFTIGGGVMLQAWATRYIFAWGFDRMFPQWFAEVDERTHAPRNALLLVGVMALIYMLLLDFIPSFNIVATGLLSTVLFILVSIAGLVLPWKMPELYRGSIKAELAGIPVLCIVAAISLVFNLVMAYSYLTNAAYGATSQVSIIFTGTLLGSGIVFYIGARLIQARRGINIGLAYHEIPPE